MIDKNPLVQNTLPQPDEHRNIISVLMLVVLFIVQLYLKYSDIGQLWADSPSYLNNSIFVPPAYPLFLHILQAIFGENNYRMIALSQAAIAYFILGYGLITICRSLNLKMEQEFFFTVLSVGMMNLFSIRTESIAYPLFFIYVSFLLKFFKLQNYRYFYFIIFTTIVICLIRTQMIALAGINLLLLIFTVHKFKNRRFIAVLSTLASLAIILCFNGLYAKYIRGDEKAFQQGGMSIVITPFYTAKPGQESLFSDSLTREIFAISYQKMLSWNAMMYCDISKWALPEESDYTRNLDKFTENWIHRQHEGSYKTLKMHFENEKAYHDMVSIKPECKIVNSTHSADTGLARNDAIISSFSERGITDWRVINPIVNNIAKTLIKNNFKDYLLASYLNFKNYFTAVNLIFVLLLAARMWRKILKFKIYRPDLFEILCLFILLFDLANSFIISLVTFFVPRYNIYSFAFMVTLSLLMLLDMAKIFYDKITNKTKS